MANVSPGTMEPLSARIPSELYLWLAQLQVEGATTNSDKLRVLLGQLKRQHDGAQDPVAAHAWARDQLQGLRDALVRLESRSQRHSEVLALLLEHLTASLSCTMAQVPQDEAGAAQLEDTLVRRAFALSDALLRQATTDQASAFDPGVVRRHYGNTLALALALQRLQQGE